MLTFTLLGINELTSLEFRDVIIFDDDFVDDLAVSVFLFEFLFGCILFDWIAILASVKLRLESLLRSDLALLKPLDELVLFDIWDFARSDLSLLLNSFSLSNIECLVVVTLLLAFIALLVCMEYGLAGIREPPWFLE